MSTFARFKTGFYLYRPDASAAWGGDDLNPIRAIRAEFLTAPRSAVFGRNKMQETATHIIRTYPREDIRLDDVITYRGDSYRVVDVESPTEDTPWWLTVSLEVVK